MLSVNIFHQSYVNSSTLVIQWSHAGTQINRFKCPIENNILHYKQTTFPMVQSVRNQIHNDIIYMQEFGFRSVTVKSHALLFFKCF